MRYRSPPVVTHGDSSGRLTAAEVAQNRTPSLAALDRRFDLSAARSVHTHGNAADIWVLEFHQDSHTSVHELCDAYQSDPNVLYAEPNFLGTLCYVPTSDPLYPQTVGDLGIIGVEQAWDEQTGSSPSVVVAVIDSGVEAAHPDLSAALDLASSFNFVDNDTDIFDDVGHGTRVAGITAAAEGNGEGIAGIGFGCRIMSLDVANASGEITAADVASALAWAVTRGADIANMSIRFSGYSQTLRSACDAAEQAGVLLVAAVGNENQGDLPVYPASFDSVMGVGAVMDDGVTRAPWSNHNGLEDSLVELVAPGATIFSCIPGSQYNGTYGSGTSFAAPMVTGVAALLMAQSPSQSNFAIRSHLLATATAVPDNQPTVGWAGSGLLNANTAMSSSMTPVISIAGVTVDDDVSHDVDNDGDGVLDEGETARLIVNLTSTGADGLNVSGTLSTFDPDIGAIANSTTSFGTVLSGGNTSNSSDPFSDIVVSATSGVKDVTFSLDLMGDGGYSDTLSFDLAVEDEVDISGVEISTIFTSDNTYHVTGNLQMWNATTIQAGTVFKVDPGVDIQAGFSCELTAVGTSEEPIVFTSAKPPDLSGVMPIGISGEIGPRTVPVDLGSYVNVRHVDAVGGSDVTGDGSSVEPWASVTSALSQINDASSSNTYAVLVAEGVYAGATVNMEPHVDMFGGFETAGWTRDIFAHETILDGESTRRVVTGSANARIDGFRITHGYHDSSGAGIYARDTAVVSNNVIVDNYVDANGGCGAGVWLSDSAASVVNNLIASNTVPLGRGGGIGLASATAAPLMVNNVIIDNVANQGGGIGALGLSHSGGNISNNIIAGNRAISWAGGVFRAGDTLSHCLVVGNRTTGPTDVLGVGGILWQGGSSISFNVISGNHGNHGGIWLRTGASPTLADNIISGNHAEDAGAGVYLRDSVPTVCNNTIVDNSSHVGGAGIHCMADSALTVPIANCILWGNSPLQINTTGAADVSVDHSDVEGGHLGIGNLDADPRFVGPLTWGTATAITYDSHTCQSSLMLLESSLAADSLENLVIEIGGDFHVVAGNTESTITIWGDVTQGGSISAPQPWEIPDYHLRSSSPCIDQGTNTGAPIVDIDGDARPINGGVSLTVDMGADEYDPMNPHDGYTWGNLWVTTSAMSATFENVFVENGQGLLSEIAAVSITDCTMRRNTEYGLRSTAGTGAISGAVAEMNCGAGVEGGGRDLEACVASGNGGDGLVGAALSECIALGNGGDGLTGTTATDCSAEFNTGDGAVLSGSALRVAGDDNLGRGIVTSGGDVIDSDAIGNVGAGIEISGAGTVSGSTVSRNMGGGVITDGSTVHSCTVENNGGVGVTGSGTSTVSDSRITGNAAAAVSGVTTVTNCAVASNAGGVSGASAISGTYVGNNTGDGISGGEISDSTIVGNSEDGIDSLASLTNSWVVGNGALGIRSSGGTGVVTDSTVCDNAGIGVENIASMTGSNLLDNGPFDASDTVGAGSEFRNFTGNWWGPTTHAQMETLGWPANITEIQDNLDGSGSHIIDYQGWLSSAAPDAPSTAPPAFLLSVAPNMANAVNVGRTDFK
ncbi:S8 family serine peptidase, partial [Candidatus Sumerlaeota bacterium]|nr:S8 family serine peptidase [Candidatus Sumerlaeota bacterium]